LRLEALEARNLLSSGPIDVSAPQAAPGTEYVRKNQANLTEQEKTNFVNALKTLKTTYRPGSTLDVYDEFVQEHFESFSSGQAHGGPAFLVWHREFLLEFEHELQTVNPTVTIPYWDFTVDNSPTSSIWADDFMGGDGDPNDNYIVKTGPFRQGEWTLAVDGPDLRRSFGVLVPTLPTPADVQAALQPYLYDVFPFDTGSPINDSFRNNIEGFNHPTAEPELHNRVHAWIGGSMAIPYSPNDPVFWMLHADIDRIWAQWEDSNPRLYGPKVGAPLGHNLLDPMSPFGVTPFSVLDHRALGYRYDTESAGNGDGGGPALAALRSWAQTAGHGLHGGDSGDLSSLAASWGGMAGEQGGQSFPGGRTAFYRALGALAAGPEAAGAMQEGGGDRGLHVCN
jgi:tyrosinase